MKSNVCKIDKGLKNLTGILKECEKVAIYNELNHKQALHLRLLCEELDGMLPKIIDDFKGDIWFEFEEKVCKINIAIEFAEFSAAKKKELINVAKNKKNAAVTGIVSKIRSALEDFFLTEENFLVYESTPGIYNMATGYSEVLDYSYFWSLDQYRNNVKKTKEQAANDELEKSIVASLADDVIVGVKGKKANIIIVKKFA